MSRRRVFCFGVDRINVDVDVDSSPQNHSTNLRTQRHLDVAFSCVDSVSDRLRRFLSKLITATVADRQPRNNLRPPVGLLLKAGLTTPQQPYTDSATKSQGRAVRPPSGVRGKTLAANVFCAFRAKKSHPMMTFFVMFMQRFLVLADMGAGQSNHSNRPWIWSKI